MKDFSKKLSQIFFHYNCISFKIKNSDCASMLNIGSNFDNEQLKWAKKYVHIVDAALSKLDKYERQLIEHVYIKGLPKTDLPYSIATYYNKRNKALEKLSNLLINTDILISKF